MSDSSDKGSSNKAQEPAPCPRCLKPFAKAAKFTVSSWFQTDPGDGLGRWQECCKCGLEKDLSEDDLPFAEREPESEFISMPEPTVQEAIDSENSINLVVTDSEYEHGHGASVDQNHEPLPLHEHPTTLSFREDAPETVSFYGIQSVVNPDAQELVSANVESDSVQEVNEKATEIAAEPSSGDSGTAISAPVAKDEPQNLVQDMPAVPQVDEALAIDSATVPGEVAPPQPPPMLPASIPANSQSNPSLPSVAATAKPTSTPSQSYMIGGRYEVDSVIGKGTFGPTYKARDVATDKLLCLKMVSTPISRHKRVVKRILQEVEKSKTLTHPHIVPIYDSGIDKSGRPFYIMDLIEQGSLKKAVKQEGFLDVPEVIDIFLDVCEALAYAHEHGMLHRDLKPSNILLSGAVNSRRAKVCDFGIIKALPSVGSEALEMTQSTDVFADPSCMSPEQCLGRRIDVRSDIYSLGCSMYEAIVGKKVFTGPNPLSVVVQHFKAAPKSFDSVMYNCDISQDVEAVVMKMLEKSPEHRYQEVAQVVEDLRLLKAHRKPNFAYQKKKAAKHPLLPFGSKQEEQDSAEKMFDVVMMKKNWKDAGDWDEDPLKHIARDINKLASKRAPESDRKAPAPPNREVKEIREPRTDEAYGTGQAIGEVKHRPALPNWRGPDQQSRGDEIWARESSKPRQDREDVILPGRMQMPQAGEVNHGGVAANLFNYAVQHPPPPGFALSKRRQPFVEPEEEPEVVVNRKMLPVYRASDSYPANAISLFCTEDEDEEEEQPLVTVEQAKREIPDYLLQVSRPTSFGQATLPLLIASITIVMMIMLFLQLILSSR